MKVKKLSWSEEVKKDSTIEYAKLCVEGIFHCKIQSSKRSRENVDGRKAFTKILRDSDYSLNAIGSYLDRDHTTIIFYQQKANDYIDTEEEFRNKYIAAKNLFILGEDATYTQEEIFGYKEQIVNLKKIIEHLNLERNYVLKSNTKYNRIGSIIDLIESKTPEGREEYIRKQLLNLFSRMETKKGLF